MSHHDVLDRLVRILKSVEEKYLGAFIDLANKLKTPSREFWFAALKKFLRLEDPFEVPSRRFTLVTSGMDFRDAARFVERAGYKVDEETKNVLHQENLKPVQAGKYKIVILLEEELFRNEEHSFNDAVAEGLRRGLRIPPIDIAFALRKKFCDAELSLMGFGEGGITIMHEPIRDQEGRLRQFVINIEDGFGPGNTLGLTETDTETYGDLEIWGLAFLAPE